MKISIISHSSVALRQFFFYRCLSKYCKLFIPVPRFWGSHVGFEMNYNNFIQKKYDTYRTGDQFSYCYSDEIIKDIIDFDPDIIYVVNEPYSYQALLSYNYSNITDSKLVIFTWDNINKFDYQFECDAVICGNKESYKLTDHKNKYLLPQVGVNTKLFKSLNINKEYHYIYSGRMSFEKGIEYLRHFKNINIVSNKKYLDMPVEYNKSRVLIVPSMTTKSWKEQMPYNIAEALSCGLHVIAFDSGSIKSNYQGVITLVPEGDVDSLLHDAKELVYFNTNMKGREWIVKYLSNEVISEKLYNIFKEIC